MNQLVFKNKYIIITDEICHFFERGLQKNVLVINKHLNISLFLHFQNHLLETKYVFYSYELNNDNNLYIDVQGCRCWKGIEVGYCRWFAYLAWLRVSL